MTPGHLNNNNPLNPQDNGDSPYTVEVNVTKYEAGEPVEVTIKGGKYKGVLIQARKKDEDDDTPIGTWMNPPNSTQLISCENTDDAVTHSSDDDKDEDSVYTWNPPNEGVGDVEIVVTVAETHDVYWVKVSSPGITGDGSGAQTGACLNVLLMVVVCISSIILQ
ncbi:putative defense protein 3 [Glandiceps talaboti]